MAFKMKNPILAKAVKDGSPMQLNYKSPMKKDGKTKEKGPSVFGVEFKDVAKHVKNIYYDQPKKYLIDKPAKATIDYLKRISPYEIQIKKKIDDKPQYKKGKMKKVELQRVGRLKK
tara:strand:+ start:216 stop:563 length:348 start_codon:yes stop_codon:yes gene_type:complete